ncbi:unnamed protein product [Paramecium pentaurelia]|uniref:Uncharacterized protein n=1 Tax=Paramecium pentaurelia TaxID=43138 RepID=A0A8S1UE74_9CILI|nr:unnamed protein product [Paramecium pentaurelia]
MSKLQRCATVGGLEVKMSHYAPDGTGRDSYVTLQNGGIWKEIQFQCTHPEIGTFSQQKQWKPPAPMMVPKFRHYQSDGSGRDNYVIADEGGLAPSSKKFQRKRNFLTSLRDYEPCPPIQQQDCFRLAQTPSAQSFTQYQKTQLIAHQQSKLIKRLNTPQIQEDPYKRIRQLSTPFYKK